ncbi:MAG TPA: hypothetical protein VN241_02665 [Microbacterium sp.]|nr:hypothetical protein [Microbacterium sp.]
MNPRTGSILIIAAVAVLVVVAAVFIATDVAIVGWLIFAVVLVTSPFWVARLAFARFAQQAAARDAALAQRHPDAVLVPIVVQRETARALQEVAAALGLRTTLANSTYGTVVVDRDAVRVATGDRDPAERAALPLRELTVVRRGQTEPPRRPLPTVDLVFGEGVVQVVPLAWNGWSPKSVPVGEVDSLVAAIEAKRA